MLFAERTAQLKPEGAYLVMARAQELEAQGREIIHLEIGQPDFDTPDNVTLAGVRLPDNARLVLHKLENHVAKPYEEFELCDAKSAGALYQVTMAADGQRDSGDWKDISYLEAIVRAYVDDSERPLQLSSGLEDYFLGTYYFNRGRYANALAGLTHLDTEDNTFSAYRFHDDDPVHLQDVRRFSPVADRAYEIRGTMGFRSAGELTEAQSMAGREMSASEFEDFRLRVRRLGEILRVSAGS